MTDRLAALELLADEHNADRSAALQHFYDTYSSQPLAMLKWLYVQVRRGRPWEAGLVVMQEAGRRDGSGT